MTIIGISLPAAAGERTVELAVDNMTCSLCGPTVRKSLSRVSGVRKVIVFVAEGTAKVIFDDSRATPEALIAATTDAGYPSRLKK
jgi:mercuric ion binding protein